MIIFEEKPGKNQPKTRQLLYLLLSHARISISSGIFSTSRFMRAVELEYA